MIVVGDTGSVDIGTGGGDTTLLPGTASTDLLFEIGTGAAEVLLASVATFLAGSTLTFASDGRAAAGRLEGVSLIPLPTWLSCGRGVLDGNAGACLLTGDDSDTSPHVVWS